MYNINKYLIMLPCRKMSSNMTFRELVHEKERRMYIILIGTKIKNHILSEN